MSDLFVNNNFERNLLFTLKGSSQHNYSQVYDKKFIKILSVFILQYKKSYTSSTALRRNGQRKSLKRGEVDLGHCER